MSKIIPYVKDPETQEWSISENLMSNIFIEMQKLGLAETVFVDGTVTNHLQFLMFIQSSINVAHIIGDEKNVELIAWLNGFGYNHACGHFCLFPGTWGKNSVELGRMTLDYWLNDLKSEDWGLEVIIGRVPATNIKAVEYTKKIGMTSLGTIPKVRYKKDNGAEGAYFCFVTREGFKNG